MDWAPPADAAITATPSHNPPPYPTLSGRDRALPRVCPAFTLTARLCGQPDASLRLPGERDPVLDLAQLKRVAKLALVSGGSSAEGGGTSVRIQPVRL